MSSREPTHLSSHAYTPQLAHLHMSSRPPSYVIPSEAEGSETAVGLSSLLPNLSRNPAGRWAVSQPGPPEELAGANRSPADHRPLSLNIAATLKNRLRFLGYARNDSGNPRRDDKYGQLL